MNRRPLYGVLGSFALSLTGTRVAGIALPWFVLVTTGSATKTGLLAMCEMLPYVLAKAFGGPVVDAVGPRRVSVTLDCISAAVIGIVPLTWALHAFHLPILFIVAAVFGAVRGPADTAKEVFIPDIADAAGLPLPRVTGLAGSIERLAGTVGPAIAGGLVTLTGPVPALAVTAVAALFSAVCIGVSTRQFVVHTTPHEQDACYLTRLREGIAFLRRDGLLRSVTVMVATTNLLDAAFGSVLIPVWAKTSGAGPAGIGLLASALSITALVGSLIATMIAEKLPRRLTFLVGYLVGGAPRFIVLATGLPLPIVLVVFAISGFGLGFINPILGAIYFERVPKHMLGRVNALADSLAWSLIPFGGIVAAGALAATGLAPALVVGGIAYFITTTFPGLRPEWKQMDGVAPATNPDRADTMIMTTGHDGGG